MGSLIYAILMGALALLGLLIASRATDGMFGFFGVGLTVFGLVHIFLFIRRLTA